MKKYLKKISKNTKSSFMYLILTILFFSNIKCNQKEPEFYYLNLNIDSSNIVNQNFPFRYIKVMESGDSIILYRNYNDTFDLSFKYYQNNNDYYQIRHKGWNLNNYKGNDTILTLSKKDTSIFYDSDYIPPGPIVNLAFCDAMFYLKKIDNNKFVSIKQSTLDTTYFEKIYYDSVFHIYKFEYILGENRVLYDITPSPHGYAQ